MKIGDYVTVQQIADQSECRWVVLTNLVAGKYGGTTAGVISFIGDNEEAVDAICEIEADGTNALLVCGTLEPLCVGSVFVE